LYFSFKMANEVIVREKRRPNFTSDEIQTLAASVRKRKAIIDAKQTGPTGAAVKEMTWQTITQEVGAASGISRTSEEVKKKWAAIKTATKSKVATNRKSVKKTGGGPPEDLKLTSVEENVLDLIGKEAVEGVDGGMDTSLLG
jgi:hypothetical protein